MSKFICNFFIRFYGPAVDVLYKVIIIICILNYDVILALGSPPLGLSTHCIWSNMKKLIQFLAVPGFPFLARLAINPQFPLEICSFGEERGNTTKSNLYCVVYTSCHFYIVRCFDPPSLVLSI